MRSGFERLGCIPLRSNSHPPKGRVNLFEDARHLWWHQFQHESYWTYWQMFRLLGRTPHPALTGHERGETIHSIVVYSPGHIGDVLMNVPLLRALRQTYESADITWMVGAWSKTIAERYAYADRIEEFSPGWYQYQRGRNRGWARRQRRWIDNQLEKQPADIFISTSPSTLDTYIVGRSCRPHRWFGRKPSCSSFPVAVEEHVIDPDRSLPEARDILRIAASLQPGSVTSALEYKVREREDSEAVELLVSRGIMPEARFVLIAPGAGWSGKQWLPDRWAQVADAIRAEGVPVVFLGTPCERELVRRSISAMRHVAVDLSGATSMPLLAAVIQRASLWLGCDSGGMHVAAAVGTPTIALFGPTNPAKWAPEGLLHKTIRAVDSCPDCIAWHPRAVCRHSGRCMQAISVEMVKRALPEWLSGAKKKGVPLSATHPA